MLYLLFKQHKDLFFTLRSGDRAYWASSVRYVLRDHRMKDRFQFFPKYNFFNFFKAKKVLSFGFKYFEKRTVSYVASKRNFPILYASISRPLILRYLTNTRSLSAFIINPFTKNFKTSKYLLTDTVADRSAPLLSAVPFLLLNLKSPLYSRYVLFEPSLESLFFSHS